MVLGPPKELLRCAQRSSESSARIAASDYPATIEPWIIALASDFARRHRGDRGDRCGYAGANRQGDGFFFVHLSDTHVYRYASQVEEHYGLGPSWTPRVVLAYSALGDYRRSLVPVQVIGV